MPDQEMQTTEETTTTNETADDNVFYLDQEQYDEIIQQQDDQIEQLEEVVEQLETITENTTPSTQTVELTDNVVSLNPDQFSVLNDIGMTNLTHLTWINTVITPAFAMILFGWWFFSNFFMKRTN